MCQANKHFQVTPPCITRWLLQSPKPGVSLTLNETYILVMSARQSWKNITRPSKSIVVLLSITGKSPSTNTKETLNAFSLKGHILLSLVMPLPGKAHQVCLVNSSAHSPKPRALPGWLTPCCSQQLQLDIFEEVFPGGMMIPEQCYQVIRWEKMKNVGIRMCGCSRPHRGAAIPVLLLRASLFWDDLYLDHNFAA